MRRDVPVCVMFGGGGHAGVLLDCLSALTQPVCVKAILDPNERLHGKSVQGIPVIGGDKELSSLIEAGVDHFIVGVGGVGNNNVRRGLFDFGIRHGLEAVGVKHPSAVVSKIASVGEGAQILAGAIVNCNARIGKNVIVNTGSIVEHDCVIEDHVHIASGARLAGSVHVAAGAHIGAGATVREGSKIGSNAIVGMGAVVLRNVPSGAVVIGVPAAPMIRRAMEPANE